MSLKLHATPGMTADTIIYLEDIYTSGNLCDCLTGLISLMRNLEITKQLLYYI